MPLTDPDNPDPQEIELALRWKDDEIAAGKVKIEVQAQVIDDQATVIAAQKAFIDRLVEQTVYHEQCINEIRERMVTQDIRAGELERRADELSQQVEWIRRRIFATNDDGRLTDSIC